MTDELRRSLIARDTFGGVVAASGRLLEDGASRAATILRRIVEGEVTALVDVTTAADPDAMRRRRTIRLAGVFLALAALIELTGGGGASRIGMNLLTAEVALAGVALVMLLASVRRLARGD